MTTPIRPAQAQIDQLLAEVGTADPREAVRAKARALISQFVSQFGAPSMPIDVQVLASLLGIRATDERPVHSPDAELVPDSAGGVKMRVNPDRPETRQRFSIGHEITHTFFPGYELKIQCRPDSRLRDRDDPNDFIETLCDVGAAEIILPVPWFADDAAHVQTAQDLVNLANRYRASREATARRFVELHAKPIAAVFLSWKLKPTQSRSFNPDQGNLWGTDPAEEMWAARELRVDYAIPSERFAATGVFVPKDKSLDLEGALEQAANGACSDGEIDLALGTSGGNYRVNAIPLYTPADERGPNGELAVVAIIEPVSIKAPKRKKKVQVDEQGMF